MSGDGIALLYFDDSSNKNITGTHQWDRDNDGILIPPSGTSFPGTPAAGEIFWRSDQNQLYRRNDGNTAWEAVTGSGDVAGPASSVDNALVRFDGTTGKAIQQATNNPPTMDDNGRIQGIYTYPPSATDPTANPTPANGDRYYNTNLNEWMFYDGSRSKWLGTSIITMEIGRAGTTPAGGPLRGPGNVVLTPGRGVGVPKCTLIGMAIARSDTDAGSIELAREGSSLGSWSTDAAFVQHDPNVDINAGRLQARVLTVDMDNVVVTMGFRRRA